MTGRILSAALSAVRRGLQTWREVIKAAIENLQERQERLEHELLGNGQQRKVKEFDNRLRLLEDHKSQSLGHGSVLLLIGTALMLLVGCVTAAWVSGAFAAHHSSSSHAVELQEGR